MNGAMGWVVAAIVIVAAGVFYFWPSITAAPVNNQQATTTPQATELSQNDISGTWRSNTDAKFTREIRPDGVMIDRYEGDASSGINGEWSVVTPGEASVTIPSSFADLTVIRVVWEGGVETTYFVINKIDSTSMTTTDLTGRGEVTVYTKV